jgi:hypothetical protein
VPREQRGADRAADLLGRLLQSLRAKPQPPGPLPVPPLPLDRLDAVMVEGRR